MNVYAMGRGGRIRLATLSAWRTVTIGVPPELVGKGRVVRLSARPIGEARKVVTEAVSVEAGDRV